MKLFHYLFPLILLSCVHDAPLPPEWDGLQDSNLNGVYRNIGIIDKISEKLGLAPYPLQTYFWDTHGFYAGRISITQKGKALKIDAYDNDKIVASADLISADNGIIINKSGSVRGDTYKATYRLWRNANGLVAEIDIISTGIFFIPLVGRDRVWIFYPEVK
jgi:hypothetical protein